jgi:hypothetical protein
MKQLYARFVLWLIRPALDAAVSPATLAALDRMNRANEQLLDETRQLRRAQKDFFDRAIGHRGFWKACPEREGRTLE